jgi:hypothetical protein
MRPSLLIGHSLLYKIVAVPGVYRSVPAAAGERQKEHVECKEHQTTMRRLLAVVETALLGLAKTSQRIKPEDWVRLAALLINKQAET